jgi:hypothetical protein
MQDAAVNTSQFTENMSPLNIIQLKEIMPENDIRLTENMFP